MFKCDWFDGNNRNTGNKDDFTIANINKFLSSNEHYLFTSQVQQVLYMEDPLERIGMFS